jgi:hypothetical protein
MAEEAQELIATIKQIEISLDDTKTRREYEVEDDLKITYPLTRCVQILKEKHLHISRVHKERCGQVKSESRERYFLVRIITECLVRTRPSAGILLVSLRSFFRRDRPSTH